MSFKLTKASWNFQSYIYLTLREYLNISSNVYLDDILIYSNDKKIHEKHVRLIFQKLSKFKLFANLKKGFFNLNKIDYLNYLMNTMKIKINFVKIQIIQIFINYVNIFRRFINKFSNTAAFLIDILKKSRTRFYSKTLNLRQRRKKCLTI